MNIKKIDFFSKKQYFLAFLLLFGSLTVHASKLTSSMIPSPKELSAPETAVEALATSSEAYQISSDADFASFIDMVNAGGANASATYQLTADVDAAGTDPITIAFSGIFEATADADGNFHTISNLDHPLFNTLDGGTVRNLRLEDVYINQNGKVGAIAATAQGDSRIYNVGILSGSVGSTGSGSDGYCGGLVGFLNGTSRVINCYSFANITGGSTMGGIVGYNNYSSKTGDIKTMVMNCMFYGTGNSIYPIYGGNKISNEDNYRLNNYNYFSFSSLPSANIAQYNCALAAEERYLVRFEFYRHLLNSNRELASWYVYGSVQDDAHDKMAKWVLDKSIAPYPILKAQDIYPSVVNFDAEHASVQTERNKGGLLGTLSVTISGVGSNAPTGASITNGSLTLNRTDKDYDNYNYNYDKVQLPYYREVGSGNYTGNKVVTGWKITGITGGTQGSFSTGVDAPAYNFADRSTYAKDLYDISGRVFSQGAYFDVPDGVTGITIEPHWGKCVYLSDKYYDCYGYNANENNSNKIRGVEDFGMRATTFDGQTVYTNLGDARTALYNGVTPNEKAVYDYAVVLVGNYHCGTENSPSNDYKPYTIMSADLDEDNEPDYCFIFHSGKQKEISPIRFDFVTVPGTAMAHKKTSTTFMGIPGNLKTKGWFEVTNTSLIQFSQFEMDYEGKYNHSAPLILLGGIYEQIVSTNSYDNNPKTTGNITYFILGDNAWFKLFNNGCHMDKTKTATPHHPISVIGGEFLKFYLSGYLQPEAPSAANNHAECYISGGKFGEVAGAGQEQVDGDVTWLIDHADMESFFGGGINDKKPVTGSINVTIKDSYVDLYCGGPKFGNMSPDQEVVTTATDCTFERFFGAGYGGTSYFRHNTFNKFDQVNYTWNTATSTFSSNDGDNKRGKLDSGKGIAVNYEYSHYAGSNDKTVGLLFVNYATLSLAQTNNVTSNLTHCTVLENFYGGGNLGKVNGDITSTLTDCMIHGNAFGAGFSATAPTATVFDAADFSPQPNYNTNTGVFEAGVYPNAVSYTWSSTHASASNTLVDEEGMHWIYADAETLNSLGKVAGNVSLVLLGDTHVDGYVDDGQGGVTQSGGVYGGGEMGPVDGTTQVVIGDVNANVNPEVYNVFGAGKGVVQTTPSATANADVSTSTKVSLNKGRVRGSVYGGGENGSVGLSAIEGVTAVSTVDINGGRVNGDVFGGGIMGFTKGNTIVNLSGDAIIDYNLFGGAYGTLGKVYVAGMRTVNMRGGSVYGNVYAGSRNADDAVVFNPGSFDSHDGSGKACVLNLSGGHAANHVFGAGFFGNTFGSAYVFIGTNAIMNAPNHTAGEAPYNTAYYNEHKALIINLDVWAGADYGVLTSSSEFNPPTISGRSDIYLDGTGYDTQNPSKQNESFMLLGKSIYGCGTSCDAGKRGRCIMIRNYGKTITNPNYSPDDKEDTDDPYITATRDLYSVQCADSLVVEASHIHIIGRGIVTSFDATEKYSIYGFKEVVRVVNGSSLFVDEPIENIYKLGSYTCTNVYADAPTYITVDYYDLPVSANDNKIRVNKGTYLDVRYYDTNDEWWYYGELQGFFHLMTEGSNSAFAFARPKPSTAPNNYGYPEYANDGGFVSYRNANNTFDELGGLVPAGSSVQMPYTNFQPSSKANEFYFRVWRYEPNIKSQREGVLNAVEDRNNMGSFSTTSVRITLPAAKEKQGCYYRIKSEADQPYIDYGTEIMTVNAAQYQRNIIDPEKYWMCYSNSSSGNVYELPLDTDNATIVSGKEVMQAGPNNFFGLTAIPEGGFLTMDLQPEPWILCDEADDFLVSDEARWLISYDDNSSFEPLYVRFMLTYYNDLTMNAEWEPVTVTLEQCDAQGNVVDEVDIKLTITTTTIIEQDVEIHAYAMYPSGNNNEDDTFDVRVMLPTYPLATTGIFSDWTLREAVWHPVSPDFDNSLVAGNAYHGSNAKVGLVMQPSLNFDNINGWGNDPDEIDPIDLGAIQTIGGVNPLESNPYALGHADGREPISFDFTLKFDGTQQGVTMDKENLGYVDLSLRFTNYALSEQDDKHQDVSIRVYVIRRGQRHRFYLDGINGSAAYSGTYPDAPKKTLASILLFAGEHEYTPGDSIFIVNTVVVDNSSGRIWNGSEYGRLSLYRYPGGHNVSSPDLAHYFGYDYASNPAFRGPLVEVASTMTLTAVTLDGSYGLKDNTIGNSQDHVLADAPIIHILDGGVLTLLGSTQLLSNHNQSTDGGAIKLENGGTLYMNDGSSITDNTVADGHNGGGIFSDEGTIILSDMVTIDNNKKASVANNIYLNTFNSVVNIGTIAPLDAYGPLDADASVGISKTAWDASLFYLPVLYSEDGMEHLANLEAPSTIVFDDASTYTLERLPLIDAEHHLYYLNNQLWTTAVTSQPEGFDPTQNPIVLNNEQQLAWAISYVNGLNGSDSHASANFVLTADLNMGSYIWVPIGTKNGETEMPYSGTFNGNGHHVKGVSIPYCEGDAGFFGMTTGANISNLTVSASFYGKCSNMGLLVGQMTAGQISCSGASGTLTTTETEVSNIGGLVGSAEMDGTARPLIHSVFAGGTLNSQSATTVGGLVGNNTADIYNAYSNSRIYGTYSRAGGLTGINSGTIENCYANVGSQTYPVFASSNSGTIQYCYGNNANYLGEGTALGHGFFNEPTNRKDAIYLYADNIVTLAEGETSTYVPNEISYLSDYHTVVWPGLLSALNQWVREKNAITETTSPYFGKQFTTWFRPTTDNINDDLPLLGLPMASSVAVADATGRFLEYSPSLDNLLASFNILNENASLFHYGSAKDVTNVPTDKVKVFINEDAVLKQSSESDDFIATVGITFDNSCGAAQDYFGNTLEYDWHLMSSSLQNAPIGISYTDEEEYTDLNSNQVESMMNGYFPDGIHNKTIYPDIKWDIYSYYEPEYHWINLKRNGHSHHHTDIDHGQILYKAAPDSVELKNESIFIPGKGYMMAINQNAYLSNTGNLNHGNVSIKLECEEPGNIGYSKGSNLIGNPYQAYLDLDEFFANTDFDAAYIYDADIGIGEGDDRAQGVYAAYTTDASINPALPSRFIHPHQGFFVITTTDDHEVVFTPSMATTTSNEHSYLRGENSPAYPLVNLFAEDPNGNLDLAVVEFERPETGGAFKVNAYRNANCQVFAHFDEQDYAVFFAKQGTLRIPVWFMASFEGQYTLRWETHHGIFKSLHLVDNLTGRDCDMLTNDRYTFTASPNDYKSRFYLTYSCIRVEEYPEETNDSFAYFDGSSWRIEGQGYLELVDVMGRILFTERLTNETNHVSMPSIAKGVYVMRLWNKDAVRTQNIIIQ